jgi:hypothetical protein
MKNTHEIEYTFTYFLEACVFGLYSKNCNKQTMVWNKKKEKKNN